MPHNFPGIATEEHLLEEYNPIMLDLSSKQINGVAISTATPTYVGRWLHAQIMDRFYHDPVEVAVIRPIEERQ